MAEISACRHDAWAFSVALVKYGSTFEGQCTQQLCTGQRLVCRLKLDVRDPLSLILHRRLEKRCCVRSIT